MVITAKYSDNSSKIVVDYTYSPKTELKTTDSTITIVYTENNISKEATQTIKVTEKNDTTNNTKKDNTIAPGTMPYTGGTFFIILTVLGIISVGIYVYKRNNDLKGI